MMTDSEKLKRLAKIMQNKHNKPDLEVVCHLLGDISLSELKALLLELRKLNSAEKVINTNNLKVVCFISDLHLGSKYADINLLEIVYQACNERGCNIILGAGDITQGHCPSWLTKERPITTRPKELISYLIDNWPRNDTDGISKTFYTIGGNHDKQYIIRDNIDVLAEVAKERPDFNYLGQDKARVNLNDINSIANLQVQLVHRIGYIYRPSSEKGDYLNSKNYLEETGINPNILHLGHLHHGYVGKIFDSLVIQSPALMYNPERCKNSDMPFERGCFFSYFDYDSFGRVRTAEVETVPIEDELKRKRKKIYRFR